MAETELTREMKAAVRGFRPLMKSSMRTVRWAEEVQVGAGYVDVIRFEDYISDTGEVISCNRRIKGSLPCPNHIDDNGCDFQRPYSVERLGIATTCFEVKITKSDFKSKNGHNLVGNLNYYVVPKAIFNDIEPLVPQGVGILVRTGYMSLRERKAPVWQDVAPEDLNRYLYNALKKWVKLPWWELNGADSLGPQWEE